MPVDPIPEGLGIEEAVVKYLLGKAAIQAVLGDRIYPGMAEPKTKYPYVTYQVISDVDEKTLDSAAGQPEAIIQLKCWGQGMKQGRRQARQAYRALRDALHGFGPGDMAGTWVHEAWLTDRSDLDDDPVSGLSDGDACVLAELTINYDDSVPTFEG